MLINDFFKIDHIQDGDTQVASITLNPDHKVYQGHFPGNPVAPGVCLVQMAKETLEHIIGRKLFMESCSNIKFTAVLNPFVNPNVLLSVGHSSSGDHRYQATFSLFEGETRFLSLKAHFSELGERSF